MTNYAKIHDLEVYDTEKLRFSDVRKTLQMSDGVKRITDVVRAPVINFIERDHEKFEQIVDLLGNESFSPIQISDDYSVDYYGDPVNFRHTLSGKDGNVRKFSITVQNDYWKLMMDWTSKEINTYWDLLDYEDAGVYTSLVNYSTVGTVADGGDYISLSNTAKLSAGYLHWSNYSVEAHCYSNSELTGDQMELFIRKQSAVTSETSTYRLVADLFNNEVRFEYVDSTPTTTVLKTWVKYPNGDDIDIVDSVYYNMKVVARGNRFDCYFCVSDVTDFSDPEKLGTAYDEKLKCGQYGFLATSINMRISMIKVEAQKSVIVYLPVGAYDISDVRMPDTNRLNDDEFSDGISRLIIAPDDPVVFRQEGSVYGGGEVKVFDTMGSVTESDWLRVYRLDRKFVGDIVISNGLIKLLYGVSTTQITLSVYSNSAWEDLTFLPDWSSLSIENLKASITELGRYSVTLREASYYESATGFDMVWTDYTIRTGSPMVNIENRRAL